MNKSLPIRVKAEGRLPGVTRASDLGTALAIAEARKGQDRSFQIGRAHV